MFRLFYAYSDGAVDYSELKSKEQLDTELKWLKLQTPNEFVIYEG